MNLKTQNRTHPFYLVYIGKDGKIISNHLEPKNTLDLIRYLAKGKSRPDMDASNEFNRQTKEGKHMDEISALLQKAISSMIAAKEQSDIDSFFGSSTTTFLADSITGLNDFELVCFMVVLDK
jgi:crotonobetainyl-CoA:carnitine CoA-transferase CaiB-like acyl-CoA transferase